MIINNGELALVFYLNDELDQSNVVVVISYGIWHAWNDKTEISALIGHSIFGHDLREHSPASMCNVPLMKGTSPFSMTTIGVPRSNWSDCKYNGYFVYLFVFVCVFVWIEENEKQGIDSATYNSTIVGWHFLFRIWQKAHNACVGDGPTLIEGAFDTIHFPETNFIDATYVFANRKTLINRLVWIEIWINDW